MRISEAIAFHRSEIEPTLGAPVGATELEISACEARLGCRFPESYREYLLWIGKDWTGVFKGTDCFINNVEQNEQGLLDLLGENEVSPPGYRPIVHFLHQGYIACWFRMGDQSEDPEVFTFSETDRATGIRPLGPFSHWLAVELSSLAKGL